MPVVRAGIAVRMSNQRQRRHAVHRTPAADSHPTTSITNKNETAMSPIHYRSRRLLLSFLALVPLTLSMPALAQKAPEAVRIGYQKSSTLLTIVKARGTLEQQLAPLGIKLSWHEFPSGLPLLEALNVSGVDLSADVADTVPVFAQAAGARLTYVAQEAPSPSAQAIVVRADSPLRRVADLKGKKIAVTKAAGSHYAL